MKLSISIPDGDIEYLDSYVRDHELSSRSAGIHAAVRALRTSELTGAYEQATEEWAEGEDRELWESATGDGIA